MKFRTYSKLLIKAFITTFLASKGWADTSTIRKLPHLHVDPNKISISGLSSGGFMAVQMHIAYSSTFKSGAGIIAGGPYYCAEGKFSSSLVRCMKNYTAIPLEKLKDITKIWAASGEIDPLSNLKNEKVYLFSGTEDSTVKPKVMVALNKYYHYFIPDKNIFYNNTIPAEHAMVTDNYGNSCSTNASPFINNCHFDLAGKLLAFLYGPLKPRNSTLTGAFVAFDQTEFLNEHGLGKVGYLYIPKSCNQGQTCKLHVALHGCKQNFDYVGNKYYKYSGYNYWAESNNIIVLYPQTGDTSVNGCWDWWGYDDPKYAKKAGRQMVAIKKMIERLSD